METRLTTDPEEAAACIRQGQLVAFPTETVYGLGASIDHPDAVAAIYQVKGRPQDNPMIVHVASVDEVPSVALRLSASARTLMRRFFPGPLTLVVPRTERVPRTVSAGLWTVGVRMPDHPLALAFLRACGSPVAAPSANLSGRPSPTSWEAVRDDLDGRIACILQGDGVRVGVESSVVDCTTDPPVLLRAGGVTLEAMRAAGVPVEPASAAHLAQGRSPGTRYRHYAPHARVRVVDGPAHAQAGPDAAYIGPTAPDGTFAAVERVTDADAYAHRLFAFFRECDRRGIQTIYCESIPEERVGRAVMDRIRRAAAGS